MLLGLTWLDWVLLLVLVLFLVGGYRRGLWVTVGSLAGFVAGAAAAFFSIPLISTWVTDPGWRLVAIIVGALVLIAIGQGIGAGIGRWIRLRLSLPVLRTVDRLAGAVVSVVVSAVVIALLAFSAASMGFPQVAGAVAESRVVNTINRFLPEEAKSWVAEARSAVVNSETVPEISTPVIAASPTAAPTAPEPGAALEEARQSVLRISGTAVQCGHNQTGSGFAVEDDRVVTNAHVLAGITDPVVTEPDGTVHAGRVVHFDVDRDLAVIAIDGAELAPLEVGADLAEGESGYVAGYPAGGPFSLGAAEVLARSGVVVSNIYGGEPGALEIYQLNADVRQGNSGGPLLDEDGAVAGVVFARAPDQEQVGFAITADEAAGVLEGADAMEETVSSGQCVSGG